jgi:hypothetical protein
MLSRKDAFMRAYAAAIKQAEMRWTFAQQGGRLCDKLLGSVVRT